MNRSNVDPREAELEQLRQQVNALDAELQTLRSASKGGAEQESFRLIAEHSGDVIARVAPDGTFLYVSPAIRMVSGYEPEELVGRSAFELVHPDDMARVRRYYEELVRRPGGYTLETRTRRKNGTYNWVESRARSIGDGQGRVVEMLVISRDVTLRKRAEEELGASEQRFRALYNRTPVMLQSVDEDGRLMSVSDYWLETLGYTRGEVVGRFIWEFFAEESGRRLREQELPTLFSTGRVRDFEVQMVRRDGLVRDAVMSAVLDAERPDEPRRSLTVLVDVTDLKRAREEAVSAHRRLDYLLSVSPMAIFTCSVTPPYDATFVSGNIKAMLGFEPAEYLDAGFWEKHVNVEDGQKLLRELPRVIDRGEPFHHHEYRFRHADGSERWLHETIRVLRDESGTPVEIIGSMEDVTERKLAQAQLHLIRAAVEQVHESVLITTPRLDPPGPQIVYVNRAFEKMTGYSVVEVIGKTLRILQGPRTDLATLDRLRKDLTEGRPFRGEAVNYRKDGTEFVLDWDVAPVRDEAGRVTHYVAIQRDITARKLADQALRESEARFRTVFEAAPIGVCILDEQNRLIRANGTFQKMLGYKEQELQNRGIDEVTHPDDRDEVRRLLAGDGPTVRLSHRYVASDGRTVYADVAVSAVRDSEGQYLYAIAMVEDVTEQRRAEERAQQHQAELAHVARLNTMGEMASGLAHELNQPLAAIANYCMGSLRRLRAEPRGPDEITGALEQIAQQADRAGQIIRRMRQYVRKRGPRRSTVDINELIRDVLTLTSPDLRHKSVSLRLELGQDLPELLVDGIQIEQVILNLVRNAAESMESIDLPDRELTLRTTLEEGGQTVRVDVSDRGRGMDRATLDRIFDPFFTTKETGMGMGLTISQSIIEAHGGRLWADSEPNMGTTFRFNLPVPVPGATRNPSPG